MDYLEGQMESVIRAPVQGHLPHSYILWINDHAIGVTKLHDGRIQSMLSAGTVDTKKKYKIYIRFIVKAREYSVCTLCNDNVHCRSLSAVCHNKSLS